MSSMKRFSAPPIAIARHFGENKILITIEGVTGRPMSSMGLWPFFPILVTPGTY